MLIDWLLRQQCIIFPYLKTEDGEDRYGNAQTRCCRLQENRRSETYAGVYGTADPAPAHAMLYCHGQDIPLRSVILCGEKTYTVSGCRRVSALGQDHLEVMLD